jgi:serine phosphatase RsbU (regulator of sigma subunit)
MRQVPIHSAAFQRAELESERLRILGVLGFFAVFMVVTVVRVFVLRTVSAAGSPALWSLFIAALILGFEYWILRRVNRSLTAAASLPPGFWIVSTILETSIPAWAIAFLPSPQIEAVYLPLASPALLVFFIFIILSTLRLNPRISVLSGVVASASYLGAALHLGWRPPLPGTPAPVTQSSVSLNAVTLLVGGVLAGAVTREIRKHVQAALREAETRRQLESVQHDLEVARSIQQSLLPRESPQIPGFEIAGFNQPAEETGGDYFDWKNLPDGKVVISLADVTGHGIGPALLAAVCRAYARSSFSAAKNLPAALENINQALGADLTSGRFATYVAAVCCPTCSDVEILSAGHGPLVVYSRAADQFLKMNAHALPFGILPSFQSDPPTRLHLGTGDLVVLATDGFYEWENDQGEDFGIDRLQEVIRASRDFAPDEIISKLYQSVASFSNGTRQQDDLTAVIIKRI